MENNEAAFEAETQDEINLRRQQSRERARLRLRKQRHSDVDASESLSPNGERAPLLSSESDSDLSRSRSSERPTNELWSSSPEFDSLPWYKRPSVSSSSSDESWCDIDIDIARFSGFFRHSCRLLWLLEDSSSHESTSS